MEEFENNFLDDSKVTLFFRKIKWGIFGAALFLVIVLFFLFGGGKIFGADFSAAIAQTFEDVFGAKSEKPIYEIDLNLKKEVLSEKEVGSASIISGKSVIEKKKIEKESVFVLKEEVGVGKNSEMGSFEEPETKNKVLIQKIEEDSLVVEVKDCDFLGRGEKKGKVIINELAWMGGENSSSDEWIEIKNQTSEDLHLENWQIKNQSGKIKIIFADGEKIKAGGFFLLERTDDDSVLKVAADKIYSGAMSNEGDWFKIFNADCELVDEINALWGWGKFGGENDNKKTLERNLNDLGWHTSNVAYGTPREKNSEPVLISGDMGNASVPEDNSPPPQNNNGDQNTTSSSLPVPVGAKTILISEVMVGSSVSAGYEFLEIYNYGNELVDLTGWVIKKKSSSGAESSLVSTSRLSGKIVLPGKYLLIAHEEEYAGAVLPDVWWPKSYTLAYTNNSLHIYSSDGSLIDQVLWVEISKDQSYERGTLTKETPFSLQIVPSPRNSSM